MTARAQSTPLACSSDGLRDDKGCPAKLGLGARQNLSARNKAHNQYFRYKPQFFPKWQCCCKLPNLRQGASSLLKEFNRLQYRRDAIFKMTMKIGILRAVLRTWRGLKNATMAFFNSC